MAHVPEKDSKLGNPADERKVKFGLMARQKNPHSRKKSGRKHGKHGRY